MSVTDDPDAWIRLRICHAPWWQDVTRLGVAVSGGGDSMALLHALAQCAPEHAVTLEAATVDHGLRPGSAEEADYVKSACEHIDCQHETLRWKGWDGRGNVQAEARAARYRLLADWARRRSLDLVALGHTMDDQAETFLMRLAREAGVDGLATMDFRFARDGAAFCRPALLLRREDLRDYLRHHGQRWCEDPSNEDESFDRVKARKALAALSALGIDAGTLSAVAANMAGARHALEQYAFETAERIAREDRGDILFKEVPLLATPWDVQRRLVGTALVWVSGRSFKPRREALEAYYPRARVTVLHGCTVTADDNTVRIAREYNAVKDLRAAPGALWDGRWRLAGPFRDGFEIRALGEAVKHCPDWRNTGLPRSSLMASPAVWHGDTLIAAPIAGLSGGFSAEIAHPRGDFVTSVFSH